MINTFGTMLKKLNTSDLLKIKENYTEKQRTLDENTLVKLQELAKKESSCVGDDRYE